MDHSAGHRLRRAGSTCGGSVIYVPDHAVLHAWGDAVDGPPFGGNREFHPLFLPHIIFNSLWVPLLFGMGWMVPVFPDVLWM